MLDLVLCACAGAAGPNRAVATTSSIEKHVSSLVFMVSVPYATTRSRNRFPNRFQSTVCVAVSIPPSLWAREPHLGTYPGLPCVTSGRTPQRLVHRVRGLQMGQEENERHGQRVLPLTNVVQLLLDNHTRRCGNISHMYSHKNNIGSRLRYNGQKCFGGKVG